MREVFGFSSLQSNVPRNSILEVQVIAYIVLCANYSVSFCGYRLAKECLGKM
jgi:hypothetical protein